MSKHYTKATVLLEAVMICATLLFAFPLYVAIVGSLKSPHDVAASPLGLPLHPVFANFSQAWNEADMGAALLSTVIIAVLSVVGLVTFGSAAAYVLARRKQKLSTFAYYGFLIGILLPSQLVLIPLYVLLHSMHLLGTYWALILVYIGGQMPFTIFLFAGFIRSLPRMYEEAAFVDGAGLIRVLFSIVLPLIRPVVGTVVVLDSVFIWNDFLTPLLYLSGSHEQTLAVSVYQFTGQYFEQWNLIFAGVVIAAMPMVGVFFMFQRSFLKSFRGIIGR